MADEAYLRWKEQQDAALPATALLHVLDALPDAVLLLDAEWRIIYANQAAFRISRLQPENLNRETLWELFPEAVGTDLERAYREVAATGQERRVEGFYYPPFRAWFDLRISSTGNSITVHYRDITAIREAEEARDSISESLQQIFAATTDAVASIDRNWRITFLNREAKELLGRSADVLGADLWQSFPGTLYDGSPYVEYYRRAMDHGIEGQFEAQYPGRLDRWFHIVACPSQDGIIVFFRDITERRLQEDALRASENRYRVLTELNPQALWTADPDGRVFYANQRFLEYIGKDFVPTDGTEYLRCFDQSDRDRVLQVWSHSVITGDEYIIDARLLRASDGASRWWHLRALPIRDEAGAIVQWLGVATDVHENRIAADRLRIQYAEIDRQRRELEAIYRGSPIGMTLYEPRDLRLLRMNDCQSELLGLQPEQALGKRLEELVPDMSGAHDMIRRAAMGETILDGQVEGTVPGHGGERRSWNVNYSPIFAESGSVQAIAGATIDNTRQKRAESALLQNEKLAAVGRLASSIAHEINNPLESVMNLVFLARQQAMRPEVQAFLDTADQELRRVSVIANQTLRFHKQSTRPMAISSEALYSTVLSIYQGKLRNSNIDVEMRTRAAEAIVCFEGDIRQVLNSLVSNAIDAMPKGGRLLLRSRAATTGRPAVMELCSPSPTRASA
jgi:PAS domain S-box-containing protein